MISNEILKDCYCSLESNNHFLNEPLELTCGHSACKQCIGKKKTLSCTKCQTINTDDGVFVESKASEVLIEMNVGDLLLKIEERFKISFESFKSKIQFFKNKILNYLNSNQNPFYKRVIYQ